jgi:hypothetical protein
MPLGGLQEEHERASTRGSPPSVQEPGEGSWRGEERHRLSLVHWPIPREPAHVCVVRVIDTSQRPLVNMLDKERHWLSLETACLIPCQPAGPAHMCVTRMIPISSDYIVGFIMDTVARHSSCVYWLWWVMGKCTQIEREIERKIEIERGGERERE